MLGVKESSLKSGLGGLVLAVGLQYTASFLLPEEVVDLQQAWRAPHIGCLAFVFCLPQLLYHRWMGSAAMERSSFLSIIGCLQLIYVIAAFQNDTSCINVAVQSITAVMFCFLAYFLRREHANSLAAVVAAHGIWDLLMHGRGIIDDWYTLACACVDFSLAFYVWSRGVDISHPSTLQRLA